MSGPVTWQATDLRIVARSVSGAERDIYAFTLVLQETQGTALTFTNLEQTVSQPGMSSAGESSQTTILWKLRPNGELRQPFSFYWYCASNECLPGQSLAPAPWYTLLLTGTDAQGRPVRLAIDLRLPPNPAGLQVAKAQAMSVPSTPGSPATRLKASGAVPFQTVNNHILLHAALNRKVYATFMLDTGATHTLLTPDAVKRFGLSPAADAPKKTLTVLGGHTLEIPLVQLTALAVGETVVEHLQVGVADAFPTASLVDGLLGEDFLERCTLTVDYPTSRLWLNPRGSPPVLSASGATASVPPRPIPITITNRAVLVRAMLNRTTPVRLLLDTGASSTLLTPGVAQRLGISPEANAPMRTLTRADGQQHTVPFVPLAVLAVGDAVVENLSVGVTEIFPQASIVDGLLGVDFLARFTLTLDRAARQLWLVTAPTAP